MKTGILVALAVVSVVSLGVVVAAATAAPAARTTSGGMGGSYGGGMMGGSYGGGMMGGGHGGMMGSGSCPYQNNYQYCQQYMNEYNYTNGQCPMMG